MKDALYIIFYPHPLAFREHPSHQYPKSSPSPGPPWLHIARWPAKALSVPVVRSASWRSWSSCSLLCTAVWTPVQRRPNPMVDHFLLSVNSFHSLLSFPILFTPSVDKATPFPLLVTLAQDGAGSWGLLESHCFDNHRVSSFGVPWPQPSTLLADFYHPWPITGSLLQSAISRPWVLLSSIPCVGWVLRRIWT